MHSYTVNCLSGTDEHEVTCQCGFTFTATTEKYADAVGKRHLQLNES